MSSVYGPGEPVALARPATTTGDDVATIPRWALLVLPGRLGPAGVFARQNGGDDFETQARLAPGACRRGGRCHRCDRNRPGGTGYGGVVATDGRQSQRVRPVWQRRLQ